MHHFKDFLDYFLRFLFSFIVTFGSFIKLNKDFLVGILAIAVILYMTYELYFNKEDGGQKYFRVISVFGGFVAGVLSYQK